MSDKRLIKFGFILPALIAAPVVRAGSVPARTTGAGRLVALEMETTSPVGSAYRSGYTFNPATMGYRDSMTLSSATLSYGREAMSRPVMVQNGVPTRALNLAAESYYKMGEASTVWGAAGYLNSTLRDMAFADCLDYTLLAPYTLGDDHGGDVAVEQYSFTGGWTTTYDNGWSIGSEASYRAATGHRATDPRISDVVSDLTLRIGAARLMAGRQLLGLSAAVRLYRQDCDVDFYNPVNHTMTLVYSGLGSHFTRFTDNMATSAGHSSTALTGSVQLLPAGSEGLTARLLTTYMTTSMRLRGLNNLTPGRVSEVHPEVTSGWKKRIGSSLTLFPQLTAEASLRRATENLFGSAVGGEYATIGKRSNYTHDLLSASAECHAEWRQADGRYILTATPRASFTSDTETLREPARKLHVSSIDLGLAIDAAMMAGKQGAIRGDASISLRHTTAQSAQWGGLDLVTPVGQATAGNFAMLSSRRLTAAASTSYSRLIGGILYTLSASWRYRSYRGAAHGNSMDILISATF